MRKNRKEMGASHVLLQYGVCISRYTPIKESNACSDISESRYIHYTTYDDDHDAWNIALI